MKRKTTKHRNHSKESVLRVTVLTPRIAWFGFLKLAGRIIKLACILAVLTGIGWGIWGGIQHAFYKNPDFRLQVIDLNPNPVIDELGVAAAAGIDLTTNPNLFDVDVKEVTRKLENLPEITAARVERHLPGTLLVRVVSRLPQAWISCPAAGFAEVRRAGAMLVDHEGFAYPCPVLQAPSAATLPVISLPASPDQPIRMCAKIQQSELEFCLLLLDSARAADPNALHWIESIRPLNAWSLQLVTRQGTSATFGLGDHDRQIANLRTALDHAGEKGYSIASINLIPKYNIPITLRDGSSPPKAIPVSIEAPARESGARRARDLSNLLHRN